MPRPGTGACVDLGSATHCGMVRELNEDHAVAKAPEPDRNPWNIDAVLAVADGLGGHLAGEVASEIAATTVAESLAPCEPAHRPRLSFDRSPKAALRKAFAEANRRIHAEAEEEAAHRQMGTTLTAVALHRGRCTIGHVGDSRAYLISGGEMRQLTEDHSWVNEQVKLGILTPEEAAVSPFRNQITRSVGIDEGIKVDLFVEPLGDDDIVLGCSDGLTDMLDDETICETVLSEDGLQAACDRLVELANEAGGRDNITVVAARYCPADDAPDDSEE